MDLLEWHKDRVNVRVRVKVKNSSRVEVKMF
jgi:hypothetical protein